MNRIAKLEIAVIIILILCIGLYLTPYLTGGLDKKKEAKVVANAAVFTSKSLAVLADGTLVGFKYDCTCKMTTKSIIEYEGTPVDVTKSCVSIAVDTNGAKSPNMIGKDRYQFAIGKLGVKFKAQNVSTTP